jgi:DNA mismatch endonuclease (patch repair protein)
MKGNRRANTRPEQVVRSELHRRGLRFRKDFMIREGNIRVKADVVFTRLRLAVFIDGCFWHSCPKHGHDPKVNTHYWGPKLERNRIRDRRVTETLRAAGWKVVRLWEHTPPDEAAACVVELLDSGALARASEH